MTISKGVLANPNQPFSPNHSPTISYNSAGKSLEPKDFHFDNHGKKVHCDQSKSTSWNGGVLSIKYSPGENTCYVTTNASLSQLYGGNMPHSGVISAMIEVDGNSSDDSDAWPAFWMDDTDPGWPQGGEIDIAERQYSYTESHLIGTPGKEVFGKSMINFGQGGQGLKLEDGSHQYQLRWSYIQDKLQLSTYVDGHQVGSSVTLPDSADQDQQQTAQAILDHFKDMHIKFDTDAHKNINSLKYEMKISNVTVS
ncbi:hypothetical protein [Piscirickettsia litoralis]|uniref:GH16 domain-containing protein n=1 Tax=Piscirickettsia litoralis TaxID=1891921 RepID=A0ABX2ZZX7_9GAMM|nr:hypothetical protein [Piscirickettsia litoralis]ODN42166.1 hypothetical protein BGC07_03420 [Piscirickettsia litoralis]